MKKKYILFPHGGSGNHGCEAIVRTLVAMFGNQNIKLFSDNVNEDKLYLSGETLKIDSPKRYVKKGTMPYFYGIITKYFLGHKDIFDALTFRNVIRECDRSSILLSIGGDNYCYGENEYIYLVNRYAQKRQCKTVLYGCSVEPEAISEKMRRDLESYDLIVARESITYEALGQINQNTVLYPDPAFTLEQEQGEIPEGLGNRPYIGINISPMIQSNENVNGITKLNYEKLIEYILNYTDSDIALIPHVVWKDNDDRKPLSELYNKYYQSYPDRIYLVEDQNCMQLKNIIANSEFFIGARTHATIAAYSTCVPTLVIGYSVKARGIAKDLFGTEQDYVQPVQNLKYEDDVVQIFKKLYCKKNEIKKHLQDIIPSYIAEAFKASEEVKKLGSV